MLLLAAAMALSTVDSGTIPPNESVSWTGPSDVAVSFSLVNEGLTFEEPPSAWDGAHLALRYQDECRSYYVSINRRDGLAVIKKKVPDQSAACGSYHNLSEYAVHPVPYGRTQTYKTVVRDNTDGTVTIMVYENGKLLLEGRDDGVGGPPIHEPGEIVLRSDNAELIYENFTIEPIAPPRAPRALVSKPRP